MPVPPNPPNIQGQPTWTPVDNSGVSLDGSKLVLMPTSLYETDGYQERLDENGWEITRYWTCNWSDVAASMQWFYGYSQLSTQQATNLLQGMNFLGQPVPLGGRLINVPPLKILRTIPAQDPYRPYLYVDHVELVSGGGAFVQDPGLFLHENKPPIVDFVDVGDNDLGAPGQPPPGAVRVPGMVYAEKVGGLVVPGVGGPKFPAVNQQGGGPVILQGVRGPEPPALPAGTFSDGMAKLRVRYRSRPYIVMSDAQLAAKGSDEMLRYVEREPNYAIQGISLPPAAGTKGLTFYEGPAGVIGQPVSAGAILLLPTQSWIYWWHDVPFYPGAALASVSSGGCLGGVNLAPFDDRQGWPQFPAQTLLCQAPQIHWRRNACGQVAFKVGWRLDYRPQGWNKFAVAAAGAGGQLFGATLGGGQPAADGSNLMYPPVDFGKLFAVAPGSPTGFFWG